MQDKEQSYLLLKMAIDQLMKELEVVLDPDNFDKDKYKTLIRDFAIRNLTYEQTKSFVRDLKQFIIDNSVGNNQNNNNFFN